MKTVICIGFSVSAVGMGLTADPAGGVVAEGALLAAFTNHSNLIELGGDGDLKIRTEIILRTLVS